MLPVLVAVLHAAGALHLGVLDRLDNQIYDARMRAAMPRTLDERIAIVDIDEKSLEALGQWPWSRNELARLTNELFDRQRAAVVGFDVVFAEPDRSSGLATLERLAAGPFKAESAFVEQVRGLQRQLDYDALFAQALQGRAAVLGYYFTSDRQGRGKGTLPAPVWEPSALQSRRVNFLHWDGYGANLDALARAVPQAGFFNAVTDSDGVVRSVPLVAEYRGQHYESLALAMLRRIAGMPRVEPAFPGGTVGRDYGALESVVLRQDGKSLALPVDDRATVLVPYRGPGGAQGGSFRYFSAADLIAGTLPPDTLKGKIVLVGTTAPGLLDLRATPVAQAYPGVETHANLLSGWLDGVNLVRPDYTVGLEVALLTLAGLLLAVGLPFLPAWGAVVLSLATASALVVANFWAYLGAGLVFPLAAGLLMVLLAFALNMSYGYFVESRAKRGLAHLFGTYVPPELVDEMVRDPGRYSMAATNREMTVMFCDMRGFTALSERMEPLQLQALLNSVFSRLTEVIRCHRGTVDKYMGDCVMAFWGAPVETRDHAAQAVAAALEIGRVLQIVNTEHATRGLPEVGFGIGINTGVMCVGDMGSDVRRSYTVIGDAVNLAARLEGMSKVYGVGIVASEQTLRAAPGFVWQELDRVRVKGKDLAVAIGTPLGVGPLTTEQQLELRSWSQLLRACQSQQWDAAAQHLAELPRRTAEGALHRLYAERVARQRLIPFDPVWDGATSFDSK